MDRLGLWSERLSAEGERVSSATAPCRPAPRPQKPSWAAEGRDLWSGLLHDLDVSEPGEYEDSDNTA
jgi:hypothetical protein